MQNQTHETVDRSRGEIIAGLGHNNARYRRELVRLRKSLRHALEMQRLFHDGWKDERQESQRYQALAAKARTEAQETAAELKNVGVELTLAVQEATRLRKRVMELEREQGKTPEEMRHADARRDSDAA